MPDPATEPPFNSRREYERLALAMWLDQHQTTALALLAEYLTAVKESGRG